MIRVPEAEIARRLSAFRGRLGAAGVRGALITAKPDRYYLAGTTQDGILWVDAAADPVLWIVRDVARARAETPLEVCPVTGGRELWAAARTVLAEGPAGVAADVLTVADLRRLEVDRVRDLVDVAPALLALRSRKSPWEIARLEETGRVAAAVFAYAAEVLRPGLTETEFAGLLMARAMSLGHEALLRGRGGFEPYSWHVLSGPNTALPGAVDSPMSGQGLSPSFPTGAGHRVIAAGEPVLVDFGVCVAGYQTDQTRTYCVGAPPAWLRDAHAAIVAVQGAVQSRLRPGDSAGAAFEAGREKAQALGLEGYLGPPGRACRFVGHGVGLETVEPPLLAEGSTQELAVGMTLASEPKAVVGTRGGVGVEDTFLVAEEGARPLAPMPLELWVV